MAKCKHTLLCAVLMCASVAFLCLPARQSNAQGTLAPSAAELLEVSKAFCDALNQADKNGVKAVTCQPLWQRLAPNFSPQPAPGSFGQFEMLKTGEFTKPGYARTLVACTHRDGVEDVLILTLKRVGNKWRVCGGPAAMTRANPLS